ncbi:DUF5335 family protein [Microvirga subterranea]|uniref:Uncharacterized protein n=1 Tax=Microvirga subterranea TaxID=186651 RepID=A0A370HVZ7_9HYPH|nr:DUF5335 family protein [Microvirga subterranea]RDI62668.1 hypothetical protein DES45_101939 [Microvirga subterranea]
MSTKMIDPADWRRYLDEVSKTITERRADVRITSLKLGSQIQAEGIRLLGVAYDPKDRVLEIALEGLDHLIRAPVELHVQEGRTGIESLSILDGEGNKHIVQLEQPIVM